MAVVEYDGTDFAGFQLQAHRASPARTVQGELERAIGACTGETVRVIGAGRTDAGVHASGQVVHFDSNASLSRVPPALQRAVNAHLAPDVKLRAVHHASPTFHARFDAQARTYCYRVVAGPSPSPLCRRFAHYVRPALSVEKMDAGAARLVGTHDFIAFAAQQAAGSTVRHVIRATVTRTWADPPLIWHTSGYESGTQPPLTVVPAGATQVVAIEVEATGFLRHMMRRIAGTLLRVGSGRLEPSDVAAILASRQKSLAGPTAPATGLCLERVTYTPQALVAMSDTGSVREARHEESIE